MNERPCLHLVYGQWLSLACRIKTILNMVFKAFPDLPGCPSRILDICQPSETPQGCHYLPWCPPSKVLLGPFLLCRTPFPISSSEPQPPRKASPRGEVPSPITLLWPVSVGPLHLAEHLQGSGR